jgi:hypothetical protein
MNIQMGGQLLRNVEIPLLWGERAVVQDRNGRLSIIDLSGEAARPEILGDEPAPGVTFRPSVEGFNILKDGVAVYSYNPNEKQLTSITLDLPECHITPTGTRVGNNEFSGNVISGFGVGIAVTKRGIAMGAPLPRNLAKLVL